MDQKILKRLAETSFFKERLLRDFFFISLAIGIALPFYYHFFVHPSFSALLTKDNEEDALSIAKHLSSQIKLQKGELEKDSLPVVSLQEAVEKGNEFGLRKIKVFSSAGEVLFSTHPGEIGAVNKERYLQEVLATGKVRANVLKRGMKSLEGETVDLDLVETYVPLMKDGRCLGAFEVYYDITRRKDQLDSLSVRSFGLLVGLAVCFVALVMAALHKANTNIVKRRQAEKTKTLQDAHNSLERMVQDRTKELLSANVQLQVEIEERKRAEKRVIESGAMLQRVFDGISEPLLLLDENLRIKMLNEAALKYYQVGDYQDVIGKPCREVIQENASLPFCDRCAAPETPSGGRRAFFERKGLFDPDRVERVAVYPIQGVLGKITSCIVSIHDITEQKKVERQMIRADRLASLGQLSGGIAHEIRSPLFGISLFVDVLCDDEKFKREAKELEIFGEIRTNIDRINNIIKRTLDFARDTDAASVEIDINHLIKEVLKFWNAKMKKSEVNLELSLARDLPVVFGDSIGLQQVMNNLIQNAVEAMNNGGLLTISTRNGDSSFYKNRATVKIGIEDTGPGILPEQQEKIFNPFYTTKPTGTGLGLAISHEIIDRQGGVLFFESKPGRGATFTVELPATSGE